MTITRRGRRRTCDVCPRPLDQPATGRPRRYCSPACRQAAYATRQRRKAVRDAWWTPTEVRGRVLDDWDITLDAAACSRSRLVENYLGLDHPEPTRRDALAFDDWAGHAGGGVVWLNPPYVPAATLSAFLARAVATAQSGVTVVGLVPASTGAGWWWTHVVEVGACVEFLRGRLAFTGPHADKGTPAPWACALVTWPAVDAFDGNRGGRPDCLVPERGNE